MTLSYDDVYKVLQAQTVRNLGLAIFIVTLCTNSIDLLKKKQYCIDSILVDAITS